MTTVLGTALVATGATCIVLGAVWYLVGRHRSHRADLTVWTPAFADQVNSVASVNRRRSPRGIEICNPSADAGGSSRPFPAQVPVTGTPVMVTGTSAPSGLAVVRALVSAGYEVVALDHDRLAPGLRFAQLGAVIPTAGAPDFGITLAKIAERTGAGALVPGNGTELGSLLAAADLLGEAGVATWFPSRELIDTCSDRKELTWTLDGFASSTPGQPGERLVAARQDCRHFEADLLAGDRGSLVAAVPRWQLATWGEQTMAAETFENEDISSLLEEICEYMQIEGPATVAGLVSDRDAVITDVSLGFSSCVALNAAAGADMVVAYARKLQGECLPRFPMPYRSGVRMVRHLDEVFET
ncbi:MAG: hypothetical protein ACLP6E_09565 [Acidimicrobiales bacterium]